MRVNPVADDQLSPTLAEYEKALMPIVGDEWKPVWRRFIRALGQAPGHAERLFPYYEPLWLRNRLGDRLTELVRLAVANQTRCPFCLDIRYGHAMAEMTEADAQAAGRPDEGDFTPREAAALRFATSFAGDHFAIDDDTFAELREHFDDEEIMELLLLCALALGVGRILMVTDILQASCPVDAAPPAAGAAA
jgi:alkylhydroperoxidase family enzyme